MRKALPAFVFTVETSPEPMVIRYRVIGETAHHWRVEAGEAAGCNALHERIKKSSAYTEPAKALAVFMGHFESLQDYIHKLLVSAHDLTGIPVPRKSKRHRSIDGV